MWPTLRTSNTDFSQRFLHIGTPKIIFHIPRKPHLRNSLRANREAGGRARRLIQYYQLPDKKSPRYFQGYLEFFAVFQNFYVFHDFSGSHWRISAGLWLRNTDVELHLVRVRIRCDSRRLFACQCLGNEWNTSGKTSERRIL